MSDRILSFDEQETIHIALQAKARGYTSPTAYVRALVEADALVELLREDWQDAEEGVIQIETSFRQAWHEAMTGKLHPIESLWDDLDDEG